MGTREEKTACGETYVTADPCKNEGSFHLVAHVLIEVHLQVCARRAIIAKATRATIQCYGPNVKTDISAQGLAQICLTVCLVSLF